MLHCLQYYEGNYRKEHYMLLLNYYNYSLVYFYSFHCNYNLHKMLYHEKI